MGEILAIGDRRDNAQLMADCAALGYLPEPILDLTYGTGRFWKTHRPVDLTTNDLHSPATHGYDYADLPVEWTETFDTVIFDPPYKLNGTSTGKGASALDQGYGVAAGYVSVEQRHSDIKAGIDEACRVSRRYVLVKCADQVSCGRVWWQTRIFAAHAEGRGFELVDMLHVQGYRRQPPGRRQLHARRDYSTLLVLRRGSR